MSKTKTQNTKNLTLPRFLQPILNSDDRNFLVAEEIPRLIAWLKEKQGYDEEEAGQILIKMRKATLERIEKQKRVFKKKREEEEKAYRAFCDKLAKSYLTVEIFDGIEARSIKWNEKIQDPVSGKVAGTPDSLLEIDFTRSIDPREDKYAYLEEIRHLYDGFSRRFSFPRKKRSPFHFVVETAPFEREPPPTFAFTLTLRWKYHGQ